MTGIALRALAAAGAVLLSACAGTYPVTNLGWAPVPEVIPAKVDRRFGVALAGGGTKASSYAMGVLHALTERDPTGVDALSRTGVISSVSGGGYASFFLYSKLLHESQSGIANGKIDAQQFFADCIPTSYRPVLGELKGLRHYCENSTAEQAKAERFQRYVRCRQDVVEARCEAEHGDGSEISNVVSLATGSAFMSIPNFVARTVFDWPVNLAPSRRAYLNGIATTYGLHPAQLIPETSNLPKACREKKFEACDPLAEWLVDRSKLRFEDLRVLHEGGGFPLWVLNATATPNRSVFSWARGYTHDFSRHIFRMSPYGMGSHHYGAVALDPAKFDPLEATVTAAAFLDTNEMSVSQPWRMLAAIGQHLAVFDWGVDVANPNVGDADRLAHTLLPFPFYYADGALRYASGKHEPNNNSAFIRLVDGGSQDNLGAWTLLENQGFQTVLISDHAQDRYGEMGDLCALRRQVELQMKGKALHFPALEKFNELCASRDTDRKLYYPIHAWPLPVVLGCLSTATDVGCTERRKTRILLLKPAFDGARVLKQVSASKLQVAGCDTPHDWKDASWNIPCEAAAYVARQLKAGSDALYLENQAAFPQNGTVTMTFNSNPLLYGAYKDLSRYQASLALELAFDDKTFDDVMRGQVRIRPQECRAVPLVAAPEPCKPHGPR